MLSFLRKLILLDKARDKILALIESNAVKCNRTSIKVPVELRKSDIQVTKIIVNDPGLALRHIKWESFLIF